MVRRTVAVRFNHRNEPRPLSTSAALLALAYPPTPFFRSARRSSFFSLVNGEIRRRREERRGQSYRSFNSAETHHGVEDRTLNADCKALVGFWLNGDFARTLRKSGRVKDRGCFRKEDSRPYGGYWWKRERVGKVGREERGT